MAKDPNEWTNLASQERHQTSITQLADWIPKSWAPLAAISKYNFNEYFEQKSRQAKSRE